MIEAQAVILQGKAFGVQRGDAALTQYAVCQVGAETEVVNPFRAMAEAAFKIDPLKAQTPCQQTIYH